MSAVLRQEQETVMASTSTLTLDDAVKAIALIVLAVMVIETFLADHEGDRDQ